MNQSSQKLAYILLIGFVLINPHPVNAAIESADPAYAASVMSAPAESDNTAATNSLVPAGPAEARYTTSRLVTAYNSLAGQTDSTPWITANGTRCHDGIVAANWLKFNTRVRIPEMFGDKVFIVADRMNPRFDNRLDVWMEDYDEAVHFGVRRLTVEVL